MLTNNLCLDVFRYINVLLLLLLQKRSSKSISPIINYSLCLCVCLSFCIYHKRLTKSVYYMGCFTDHQYFSVIHYLLLWERGEGIHDVLKCFKMLAEGIPLHMSEVYIFLWVLPRTEKLWKCWGFFSEEVKDVFFCLLYSRQPVIRKTDLKNNHYASKHI